MRGRFITFEGIDGAGKSTHIGWLAAWLAARGIEVVSTREPGGTPLGERLRELLLHEPMALDTEILLMFAARNEHLERVIRPALREGKWVLCDRFSDASFAYQGGGRGADPRRIEMLERWVHADLQPDLTVVFDVTVATAGERRAASGSVPDRFERESPLFFERVAAVYRERAGRYPDRMHVVDAGGAPADIHKSLEQLVITCCFT
ncbi:MAG: dTMP kinase [Rhodocyclaceae bacterium]